MSSRAQSLFSRVEAWLSAAVADGFCGAADAQRLESVERASSDALFTANEDRPLVVALFGGTGVGKSSLVNRLLGEAVSRVGVERPTTREVTLAVHRDVRLAALPPELPVDRARIVPHASGQWRSVALADMPDVDSADSRNLALVRAWLPCIDLLVYVVSPERYRDDVGWRMLQERGGRHGWIFVLNRWDEGHPAQREQFDRMLRDAGFISPLLRVTSCQPINDSQPARPATPDDFAGLCDDIHSAAETGNVAAIRHAAEAERLRQLGAALAGCMPGLGRPDEWQRVRETCERRLAEADAVLAQGLDWPIRSHAQLFARRDPDWMTNASALLNQRLSRKATTQDTTDGHPADAMPAATADREPTDKPTADHRGTLRPGIWDAWADAELAALVDAVELEALDRAIRAEPLRQALDAESSNACKVVNGEIARSLRLALAGPGGAMRRWASGLLGVLSRLLPLAALIVVAYSIVRGYLRAVSGEGGFLDLNFALHSALFVLIAWALPYSLHRLLRPRLERTAEIAMRSGLRRGFLRVGQKLTTAIDEVARRAGRHRDAASDLLNEITPAQPESEPAVPFLRTRRPQ
ncbi:MAG: 50S ribosome-binding GTPase [Phycisphaerales bacterium]|nr:50S ribosome-binding GTPase [Phycisphaerales bacterium]